MKNYVNITIILVMLVFASNVCSVENEQVTLEGGKNSRTIDYIVVPSQVQTIQSALDMIDDGGTVEVLAGTYIVNELTWTGRHINLVTNPNNPAILTTDGNHAIYLSGVGINNQDLISGFQFENCEHYLYGACIALVNGATPTITNCKFLNNSISAPNNLNIDVWEGVGVCILADGAVGYTEQVIIENCEFNNNFGGDINGGAGLALYGPASVLNCSFIDNYCMENNGSASMGGAILIYNADTSGDIVIDNCIFEDNHGQHKAHDIMVKRCDNMDNIVINECEFYHTANAPTTYSWASSINLIDKDQFDHPVHYSDADVVMKGNTFKDYDCGAVYFFDENGRVSLDFRNNVIDNCETYGFYLHYYGGLPSNPDYLRFDNNTLINIDGNGLVLYRAADYVINNNIFANNTGYGIDWDDGSQFSTESLEINYSLFNNNTLGDWDFSGSSTNPLTTTKIYSGDPCLDSSYEPIWNTTTYSPCIDMGHPNLDGDSYLWVEGETDFDLDDCDPDMTRMDVGAVHFDDPYHDNNRRKFTAGINWICFPALGMDKTFEYIFDEYDDQGWLEIVSLQAEFIDEIRWKYPDDEDVFKLNTTAQIWEPVGVTAKSNYGYKVKLVDGVNSLHLEYSGHQMGSTINPDVGLDLPEYTGSSVEEYWLGYYVEQSMSPFEALDDVIDDIVMIKAQDWCISRVPIATPDAKTPIGYTDNWEIGGDLGDIAINYGEMVSVKYIGDDVNFSWGPDDPQFSEPYYRKMTTHFEYEEQEDYIPIYIEIFLDEYENGEVPIEIAIFVNDECKGASLIKDDQVQLNAYILNEYDPVMDDLEFRMYFPSKQKTKSFTDYKVMNYATGHYEYRHIDLSEKEDFYKIGIDLEDNGEDVDIVPTKLFGNYPNPFNPTTTIMYSLGKANKVNLDVFNIRGQKVATLVNEYQEQGRHEITWNGKDKHGKNLPSGVYFYKLITPLDTLSEKMLLLK